MQRHISLYLMIWTIAGITRANDVIFVTPSENDGSIGSACTTKEGGRGQCKNVLNCIETRDTFTTNPPAICGFTGTIPIVCCPNVETTTKDPDPLPSRTLDISPPSSALDLNCGESIRKFFFPRFKRSRELPATSIAGPATLTARPPVVGGFESERNAWPWMALIGIKKDVGFDWFCGGVLINEQWVLTAAHCSDAKNPTTVRLGEHNYESFSDNSDEEDFEISKIVLHPNYSFPVAYHDLALYQLKNKVVLKRFISPVCLPWGKESQRDLTGRTVKLTGWGDTEFAGSPSPALQEVNLKLFSTSVCHRAYSALRDFAINWPSGIGNETVCAGHEQGGRDACQGDSGGPLTYRNEKRKYFLSGIVSTGYGCGSKNFPGIYANILHPPHLAWIKKVAF